MTVDWNIDADIDLTDLPLGLVVGWRSGTRVRMGQVNLSNDVGEALRHNCQRFLAEVQAREARPYAPEGQLEPEEYFAIPHGLVADHLGVIDRSRGYVGLDLVRAGDLRRKNLYFYAVVVGDEAGAAVFISKSNPSRIAHRGYLVTTLRDGLARVDDPVFLFDPNFDLAILQGGFAVLEQSVFEMLFRQTPALRAVVGGWVTEIAELLPMDEDDRDALIGRVQRDSRLARRLRAIHERGHLRDVPLNRLRESIANNGLDPDRFIVDDRLVWEDADTPTLLRVLNEDLFVGGLTGEPFMADRKTSRGR